MWIIPACVTRSQAGLPRSVHLFFLWASFLKASDPTLPNVRKAAKFKGKSMKRMLFQDAKKFCAAKFNICEDLQYQRASFSFCENLRNLRETKLRFMDSPLNCIPLAN
jgi:hypothetical protein